MLKGLRATSNKLFELPLMTGNCYCCKNFNSDVFATLKGERFWNWFFFSYGVIGILNLFFHCFSHGVIGFFS